MLRGAQAPFVGVAASVGAGLKLCVSPSPPWSELPYPGRRSPRRLQAASAARRRCRCSVCCLIATTIDGASSAQVGSLDDGLLRLLCCTWRRRPMCVPGVRRVYTLCVSLCVSLSVREMPTKARPQACTTTSASRVRLAAWLTAWWRLILAPVTCTVVAATHAAPSTLSASFRM